MKTKFGLLSFRSALTVLVFICGYANAGIAAQSSPPASLQLSLVYPSNGVLVPGQSQVVQVAAAIQPSPGTAIHAYLLMVKVHGPNGHTLVVDSFYPSRANPMATLNMKNLVPGDYSLTGELRHNATVVSASQKYRIRKPEPSITPTPTATPTRTAPRTAIATPTPTRTGTKTSTPSATPRRRSTPTATRTAIPTATATLKPPGPATPQPTGSVPGPKATPTTSSPTAKATSTAGIPVAQVASTPAISGVYRMGVNMGGNDFWGPGDFMQNMFDNPGFEPVSDAHLIIVGSGASSGTFTDSGDNGKASNYWNGALASVRTGTAAGDTFTITGFTVGGSYSFGTCQSASGGSISCPTLAAGTGIGEVLTGTDLFGGIQGNGDIGGWGANDSESDLSTAEAYDGVGSLAINVSGGASHSVSHVWDFTLSVGGVCSNDNVTACTVANENSDCGGSNTCLIAPQAGPWHPVVGAFEIAFYAKGVSTSTGTPQVTVSLVRTGGTNVSHTFTLTNDGNWHQYVFPFTGTDTEWSGGAEQKQLTFTLAGTNNTAETGATIYVDDVYLGRTENSASGFRDEMIKTLQAINPGSLRIMNGGTISASDAGLEGIRGCTPGGSTPDAPGTCDFEHGPVYAGSSGMGQWTFAASDLYPLAAQFNAVPFITISNVFTDADLKTFVNNACAALNAYNLPAIYVEQSNEEWNSGSPSRSIKYGSGNLGQYGYAGEAGRNFSVMSAQAASQCPSLANRIHYVIGNQICNSGVISAEMTGASAAGYPIPNTSQYGTDAAPYYAASGESVPSESGSLSAQAAAYAAAFFGYVPPYVGAPGTGCINNGLYSDYGQVGSNNTISFYETGPGGWNGPATTEQSYLAEGSYASAGWMAESFLMGQQLGRTPIQNEFTLTQEEYAGAPIWGIVHDLDSDFGPTFPHLRPIAMGEEVVNSAIGGAYYPVNAPSGTVISAYQNAGAWSAALVNTTAAPITLTVEFPSSGTVPKTAEAVLNTNGMTDNSENSNDVYVGALPGGLNTSGQNVTLTLPPYSVVAIH
jgi:hypothetical protein